MPTELEDLRREKCSTLREMGINPYPAAQFQVSFLSQDIKKNFDENKKGFENVYVAGRIMRLRIMGKASFFELQDSSGTIQIYVQRNAICKTEDTSLYDKVVKKLLDIGDFIGVEGHVFKTKMGEITIHVKTLTVLSKSLKPLPIEKTTSNIEGEEKTYDQVHDPEFRYRQRYVDLILHPKVKDIFIKRTKIIDIIREKFNKKGYLEVETPILQPIYGGALAQPFKTNYHNLNTTFYLRIANELYLKRLIVGGFDGVYEFARDFRNEGMSRYHNPEFTMLELYVAYKDYHWMSEMTEKLIEHIAIQLHGRTKIPAGSGEIDFKTPWKRWGFLDAIKHFTGIDVSSMDEAELGKTAVSLGIPMDSSMQKGKIMDEIFSKYCEPKIIEPTFIMDYPIEMSPLSKNHRTKKGLVERFEVICNGKEICNAFSELNDPIDQKERFEQQRNLKNKGDKEAMEIDKDFIRALEYGMPPAAGIGIGMDRLTMLMTNAVSIQEVLLFPHMRPEKYE